MVIALGLGTLSAGGSLTITGSTIQFVNDSVTPGSNYVYATDGSGVKGWRALSAFGATSITGTAGQVLANGNSGTSETGAITLTLASALTSINSITSATGQSIVLATGTAGTALSIASASLITTLTAGLSVSGATAPDASANERITISNSYDGSTLGRFYATAAGVGTQRWLNGGWNVHSYGTGGGGFMCNGMNGIFGRSVDQNTYVSTQVGNSIALGTLSTNGFTTTSPTFTNLLLLNASQCVLTGPSFSMNTGAGNSPYIYLQDDGSDNPIVTLYRANGVGQYYGGRWQGGSDGLGNSAILLQTAPYNSIGSHVFTTALRVTATGTTFYGTGGFNTPANELSYPAYIKEQHQDGNNCGLDFYCATATVYTKFLKLNLVAGVGLAEFTVPTTISSGTTSSSTTSGALIVTGNGGVGITGATFIGRGLTAGTAGANYTHTFTGGDGGSSSTLAIFKDYSDVAKFTIKGDGIINVSSATEATTVSAASMVMSGGLSIAKSIIFGGSQGWGINSTPTTGGTTTLAAGSQTVQIFTGATSQICQLPAANLYGPNISVVYIIKNRSQGIVTIQRAGFDVIDGNTSYTLSTNGSIFLVSNGAASWSII